MTIKSVCSHSLFKNEFRQCIQCELLCIFTNIVLVVQNNVITNNMYPHRYTRSVQKVSRILNFRGLYIFDFRFFVALCWYSCLSLMPTSSAILNVQSIFDSCFACTCFGSFSIFAYSKKWIKESVSNFM